MEMYEQYRNAVAVQLSRKFDDKELRLILQVLDTVSTSYNITKNDALVVAADVSEELIATYLVCKKMEGLSDGTLKNYKLAICNFFKITKKLPDAITANDVRAFLYYYKSVKQCSDRSLDKVRQYINGFFAWANSEGYITQNPCLTVKAIKHEIKQREYLTQIELEQIRRATETAKEAAIVEFLYSTGCRRAELCGVKLSDVDMVSGTVHLFGKGKKHRTSYLNAKAVVALSAYLKERKGENAYLFQNDRRPYGQMSGETLEKVVGKICQRADIDKNVTPHIFRHTTATQALRSGMQIQDIQKFLGHENISTTMIYATADANYVKAEHLRCVV